VIVSYRDARTADFARGKRVKALSGLERPARLKLDRMEAAVTLEDLAALPGNRFEALKGDRKGQYSIRINDQWRICFEWPEKSPGPTNVEIVDYHQGRDHGAHRDSPRGAPGGRTGHTGHERG
jgi:proteic killer suppression protein